MEIFSVGHGARPLDELLELLRDARVEALVDIRLAPGSRRHPQFGASTLAAALAATGIQYAHLRGLGGRREPRADSPHRALRVAAFRGYADHMASDEFAEAYAVLTARSQRERVAFMCAETLWWRCHRRLIADRLTVDGWNVAHLLGPGKSEPHRLWDAARVADSGLVYDAIEPRNVRRL